MKHFKKNIISIMILLILNSTVQPQIEFGDQRACIRVRSGVTLQVDTQILSLSGALQLDDTSYVAGNPVSLHQATFIPPHGKPIEIIGGSLQNSVLHFWYEDSILDAKGAVLDLNDYKLSVGQDVNLTIKNATLRGVSSHHNNFVMFDDSSCVFFDNVTLDLDHDFTLNKGTFTVVTPSTFVIQDTQLSFEQTGKLVVDDTLLNIETYAGNGILKASEAQNSLSLVKTGTIRYNNIVQGTINNTWNIDNNVVHNHSESSELTEHPLKGVIDLNSSVHIAPGEKIQFDGDATVQGNGSTVVFSRPKTAQFIVPPGKTIRMDNIELLNIGAHTFSLGYGSTLILGHGVHFSFSQDVHFDRGRIRLDSTQEPCLFSGMICPRRITFQPDMPVSRCLLDLNSSMLSLENVTVQGSKSISSNYGKKRADVRVAIVCLQGHATYISDTDPAVVFVVEGKSNVLQFMQDKITIRNPILFADKGDNELCIKFSSNRLRQHLPQISFADNTTFVESAHGTASLIFLDPAVQIHNQGANSVQLGENGLLDGTYLTVKGNPIKSTSITSALSPQLVIESEINNALDLSYTRMAKDLEAELKTAANSLRQQKEEELYKAIVDGQEFSEPRFYDSIYYKQADVNNAKGAILVHNTGQRLKAIINNFGFDVNDPAVVTLQGGACLRCAPQEETLKDVDVLFVKASNCKHQVIISDTLILQGKILLEPGAHLEFVFDPQALNPQLCFDDAYQLEIPDSATISFVGKGTICLPNKFCCRFNGETKMRSSLSIQDSVVLKTREGKVVFTGTGTVAVCKGARFVIDAGGECVFGNSAKDDLKLSVFESGIVCLQPGNSSGNSYLAFCKGKTSIEVTQGGVFDIGTFGVVDLNCHHSQTVHSRGLLERISFAQHGILHIAQGGLLRLGCNKAYEQGTQRAQEMPYEWDNQGSLMYGHGGVELVGTGVRVALNPAWKSVRQIKTPELYQLLTGKVASTRRVDTHTSK